MVGEREQGTLEPVLTTPVTRAELLIGKAAAVFMPAVILGYLIFGVFVAITQLAAASPVAAAVRHAPQLPAALVFIPLLAAWAIWAERKRRSIARSRFGARFSSTRRPAPYSIRWRRST